MASQTTQEALHSLDQAEFLGVSTRTQEPIVTFRLEELFSKPPTSPMEGGEDGAPVDGAPNENIDNKEKEGPDWGEVQVAHADLLGDSTEDVRVADKTHRLNKVKLSLLRQENKALIGGLKTRHRDWRNSIRGTYGEEALALAGLDAPPARVQLAFREQCGEVYERMTDAELLIRFPDPRAGQAPLKLKELATEMKADLDQLEELAESIKEMGKRIDESLVTKREAIRRHRRIYINLARIQEGYYRLVELDELARRIRLGTRAPRSQSQETEVTTEPTGSTEPTEPKVPTEPSPSTGI